MALVVYGAENFFELCWDLAELADEVERVLEGDGAADLGEVESQGEERSELGGEGLGARLLRFLGRRWW